MTESKKLQPDLIWRPLSPADIPALAHIAAQCHPALPESNEVFAERVSLFPEGCLALVDPDTDTLLGYLISHPIRYRQPPALNCLLDEIASNADQYYIHDLAILPALRGRGCAREGVERVLGVASRYPTTSLVSVYGTAAFWERFGFEEVRGDDGALRKKVEGYGDDAVYLERQNGQ
ncbi:MAG: hypothetical protein Q9169_008678 [Polycauliona sp. 2 TL-2023]